MNFYGFFTSIDLRIFLLSIGKYIDDKQLMSWRLPRNLSERSPPVEFSGFYVACSSLSWVPQRTQASAMISEGYLFCMANMQEAREYWRGVLVDHPNHPVRQHDPELNSSIGCTLYCCLTQFAFVWLISWKFHIPQSCGAHYIADWNKVCIIGKPVTYYCR